MIPPPEVWEADLEVGCGSSNAATRLYRVLAPEASREVPRARAELPPPTGDRLVLHIWARDTGALRAAVQTYLGWVQLEAATEGSGSGTPAKP
jgi:tRNA threonylcarbamoyladenosine modification (KEOPS) complex  Pcc1 subunit